MKKEDEFPRCRIQYGTSKKLSSRDAKVRYKTLRNVSDRFISRKDVREYIFEHKGRKCYLCGSSENLQIDHKISVYRGAHEMIPCRVINGYENLMPICRKCNSGKRVEEI